MDPRYSAQDIMRCTVCKAEVAPVYCNVCHTVHLCKDCVVKHFSGKSKVHHVVPLKQFFTLNYPKCPNHPTEQCKLHCQECDVPFCTSCISSGKHLEHKAVEFGKNFENKKEVLKRDLQELEYSIFPKYQESATVIMTQKDEQRKNLQKLTTALQKHGEAFHKEIDTFIKSCQSKINNMDSKLLTALDKQEKAINRSITEIKQVILHLKSLLDTSDVCLVSKYKSRNEEFRKLPPKLKITFSNFQPQEINREQVLKQFGFLSPLSIETEEQGYISTPPRAEFSAPERPLLDVPRIITELATEYKYLYGVSCLSDKEIWTHGDDKILKLYNLQGELVNSVQTKLGIWPIDIAVTRSGDLLYADHEDRSINLVSDTQIQKLIKLRGWGPLSVYCSFSGDILVIMDSDDGKQTKVVRYSGSTEKQSIQWDGRIILKALYSSSTYTKFLTENRNLDICVADCDAHAVVVVSAAGKLRFRYTGPPSATKNPFKPRGITTDSQGRILTADWRNDRIHVLDQDGHFLRYIDNCGLRCPWGLCVDSRDNLFVAECRTGKVKKIQYYK